jgi:hypothetical protein
VTQSDVVGQLAQLEPLDTRRATEHEPAADAVAHVLEHDPGLAIAHEGRQLVEDFVDELGLVEAEDPIEGDALGDAHGRQA